MCEIRNAHENSIKLTCHLVKQFAEVRVTFCIWKHIHYFLCPRVSHVHITESKNITQTRFICENSFIMPFLTDADKGYVYLSRGTFYSFVTLCRR